MKNSRLKARSFLIGGMMGQPPGTGLPESREKVLKMDGAFAPRVFRIDGLSGRGLWYRLTAMNINAACGSAPFGAVRHQRGGEPPEAAKHRDAYLADESKSIKPESAGSWQLEADCFRLYMQWLFLTDRDSLVG